MSLPGSARELDSATDGLFDAAMTSPPYLETTRGYTRPSAEDHTRALCSEAQFKTLKYPPAFARRFDSIELLSAV